MLSKEEFQRTFIRMMDSVRHNDAGMGKENCDFVFCEICPLYKFDDGTDETCFTMAYSAMDIIELVEQWGKEHPITTNIDKYKEVFGVEPNVVFDCPPIKCPAQDPCDSCREKFWNAEYIPPKKEE